MSKMKFTKKKTNSQKKIAKMPEHLKQVQFIAIRKRAQIIPIYDESQLVDLWHRDEREEVQSHTKLAPKIVLGSKSDLEIDDTNGNHMSWFKEHRQLGSMILKFIKTEDPDIQQDLGAKIIEKDPTIVFDDGSRIALAMFLCKPPKQGRKLRTDKKIMEGNEFALENIKDIEPYEDMVLYAQQEFFNPFRELLLWWSALTLYGKTSNEQEKGAKYLERLGFSCFDQRKTHKGRRKALLSPLNSDRNKPFSDLWLPYISQQSSYRVSTIYRSILKDIQELFEKAGKLNRREALRQYVEGKKLVSKLSRFLGQNVPKKSFSKHFFRHMEGESPDRITNMVINELIKLKKPSEIAWSITGAILGVGTKTLKKLYQPKEELSDWVKELISTSPRG